MIVKPHDYFSDALNNHYALGAFNTVNMEMTKAIINAAEKKNSAVIVQTSESAIEYAGLDIISGMIKLVAESRKVPVMMHLDHGKSLEVIQRCMDAGYGSVMIDASQETLEDNIAITQEVVTEAHARGVWVEAELGAILGDEGMRKLHGELTPDEMLTNPHQVVEFVRKTGVDALAISVGTIHGAFTGQEYVRFELIEKIEKIAPDLPLVIHGASGITNEHIRKVSRYNVCKVNVDTEVRIAFLEAVKSYFGNVREKVDVRDIMRPAQQAMQRVVEEKIEWLGSGGRADV